MSLFFVGLYNGICWKRWLKSLNFFIFWSRSVPGGLIRIQLPIEVRVLHDVFFIISLQVRLYAQHVATWWFGKKDQGHSENVYVVMGNWCFVSCLKKTSFEPLKQFLNVPAQANSLIFFGNGEFSRNAVKIHWGFKNATNSFDMTTKLSNLLGSSATCCCSTSDAVSLLFELRGATFQKRR